MDPGLGPGNGVKWRGVARVGLDTSVLEQCKGIYITTGSQTLQNNARVQRMKGSALCSTELVQNGVGAAPIQTVWAYLRMGLTKHMVMSQADSFGLGS